MKIKTRRAGRVWPDAGGHREQRRPLGRLRARAAVQPPISTLDKIHVICCGRAGRPREVVD
jgi:hypothetical protein